VKRSSTLVLLGLIGASVLGGALTMVATAGSAPRTAKDNGAVGTATVRRMDLRSVDLVDGTLGFAPGPPVINRLSGTYTALPVEGANVQPGQSLYAVDNDPVILLLGAVPAWRPFSLGMGDGPDIGELESNLVAEGFVSGGIGRPGNHFDVAMRSALIRWQMAKHLPITGSLDLGTVIFLPAPVRVGIVTASVGGIATPGAQPFEATTWQRIVTIPLDAGRQAEAIMAAPAAIDLPNGASVPGTITAIGNIAAAAGTQGGGSAGPPTVNVTVTPQNPNATGTLDREPVQVELTSQSVTNVLAAPISALLALADGGYGVEVIRSSGTHALIRVRTGLFADTMVEISGVGIGEGTKVVIAQ